MKSLKNIILTILILIAVSCQNEPEMCFSVHTGEYSYLDCPVVVDIHSLKPSFPGLSTELLSTKLNLIEISKKNEKKVSMQLEDDGQLKLCFVMEGITEPGKIRKYKIIVKENRSEGPEIMYSMDRDEIKYYMNNKDILRYRISELLPPDGVDSIYKRSGYIHPLFSPGGEILTRIQAPDHYHHYGIWNPWTLTHINGREIDYWNLASGEGTVRHRDVASISGGKIVGQFIVNHDYIDFGSGIPERKTMDEQWDCKIWNINSFKERYLLDLQTKLINVLSDTIIFDAYRYGGGLGYRATEKWNTENSSVLTSEGNMRETADGTRARWCIVEGVSDTEAGRSGILFLSHPENREHPEPMRVWPADVNHGELFFEFCPIRLNKWIIEPAKEYTLRYRMVVFDGAISPDEADMYWNGFAYPPEVYIE